MEVEIRPYGNGWGLWIDDKWVYGNESGTVDGNVACHILVKRMQALGMEASYKMVVPADRLRPKKPGIRERLLALFSKEPIDAQ